MTSFQVCSNCAGSISATIKDDLHTLTVQFDCVPWFLQASDEDILQLARCDFGGDEPADRVGMFMADTNEQVADVFKLLELLNSRGRDRVGFEVHVNADQAEAWLAVHRPAVAAILRRDEHGPHGGVGLSSY